ncbi:MAG: TIM barrel protein [Clostridia bacterium]
MYTVFDASETFFKVRISVQDLVPLLVKRGIRGINPPAALLETPGAAREAAKCVRDAGLKWGLLPTPVDFLAFNVSDEMFDQGIETLKVWADTAEKMGVQYSYNHIFPGNDERAYAENFEWHVIRIRQIHKIMKDHGIHYGNEFLGPWDLRRMFKYPFIHKITGQRALADAIDPDLGFLFDTFHWFCGSDAEMDDLYYAAQHVDQMVCFHINDGVAGKGAKEQLDLTRAMPMSTGVIDALTPYQLFKARGYTGPLLCEPILPLYDDFRRMPADEVVRIIADGYDKMEQLAAKRSLP